MKIAKFGGSSVADVAQIKKVLSIFNADDERRVIVVSAPGRRYPDDTKLTDLLIELYHLVIGHADTQQITDKINTVLERFQSIEQDLPLKQSLIPHFKGKLEHLIKETTEHARLLDALKSCGEDFNAELIAAYNTQQGIDTLYYHPRDAGLFVTDEPGNARVLEESYTAIKDSLPPTKKIVIPGFFGISKTGHIVTFSRGGSDLTGAVIARALDAGIYENYTDVSGIFSANPNIIPNPNRIEEVTYDEMRELSYAGFNVFHDEAIAPLYSKEIPVVIKNTNRPEDPGTLIVSSRQAEGVVGVSCDKGFASINIKKYMMNREIGFTRKLLSILEDLNISYEHIPSGIDNVSIILREHQLHGKEALLTEQIRTTLNIDQLSTEKNLAILMIVGEGMKTAVGTANKATQAFMDHQINLKMINQGSSEISMMFGIEEKDAVKAVKAVYNAYF
ncbi:aspartate kinase [Macrococcus equipercicus]|uniref:Aspartokinase n=1 Tax=Macrococcus equipercicus TaxID=69967 RepID=A0ABQ6RAL6_9STAP|nr:aspartate kinase [Macrococcus equipercicus]KAA1040327.1 aspartate kinase [Macrococcus equipercicus]